MLSADKSCKTCVIENGTLAVHTVLPTGEEMYEEYEMTTKLVKERRVRRRSRMGALSSWEWEVGEPIIRFNPDTDLIAINKTANPQFLRLESPTHMIFKVRNLPYPSDVYAVGVDEEEEKVIIRTSNKKYYKCFHIWDLRELNIPLSADALQFSYANNTLTLMYTKPRELIALDQKRWKEAFQLASK